MKVFCIARLTRLARLHRMLVTPPPEFYGARTLVGLIRRQGILADARTVQARRFSSKNSRQRREESYQVFRNKISPNFVLVIEGNKLLRGLVAGYSYLIERF